ncbi:50S ribosomal protein L2 [Galdieria sulphuraria]|nr:50S ribosomal protein L2 [Galdieria sulphuraria]
MYKYTLFSKTFLSHTYKSWTKFSIKEQWIQQFSSGTTTVTPKSTDPTRPSIIKLKPITPARRECYLVDLSLIYTGPPVKELAYYIPRTGGRDSYGHISVRHRGGGFRGLYRLIDFKRTLYEGMKSVVQRIEYDPYRTGFVALLQHYSSDGQAHPLEGQQSYIICPQGLSIAGIFVHNIETHAGDGGILCRAAGTYAKIVTTHPEDNVAVLRLASKELRKVPLDCMATIGKVSNPEHKNEKLGSAGRMRDKGRRPHVRGVAMNPVDHPHGGGEGRTSGGRPSVSAWGKPTKCGYKTRRRSKKNPFIIERRPSTYPFPRIN